MCCLRFSQKVLQFWKHVLIQQYADESRKDLERCLGPVQYLQSSSHELWTCFETYDLDPASNCSHKGLYLSNLLSDGGYGKCPERRLGH